MEKVNPRKLPQFTTITIKQTLKDKLLDRIKERNFETYPELLNYFLEIEPEYFKMRARGIISTEKVTKQDVLGMIQAHTEELTKEEKKEFYFKLIKISDEKYQELE